MEQNEGISTSIHATIRSVSEKSHARIVAYLATRSRDLSRAEDATADAFAAALEHWPAMGIPKNPEAWLLTVARRKLIDQSRSANNRTASLDHELSDTSHSPDSDDAIPDERLKLLFVCAHPAIDPAIRTPLMLQAVLGLDAAKIASAFLVSPAAMSQRLVRVKTKIRDAGIRFDVPGKDEYADRLDDVLESIYGAFSTAHGVSSAPSDSAADLLFESVHLARMLVELIPHEPEPRGLLALLLYCDARRAARIDLNTRAYVPISEQDTNAWNRETILEAEAILRSAAGLDRIGRFQLEAAIQSAHSQRIFGRDVSWSAIVAMYDRLADLHPTIGSLVARAAAIHQSGDSAAALAALDELDDATEFKNTGNTYQPYWAVRAHALVALDEIPLAVVAFDRAIGLSDDPAVRDYLLKQKSLALKSRQP